jgi:hypothetical protein
MKFRGRKNMVESNRYFKDHTERRIREIQERARNLKAEKIKEKIIKIKETQGRARRRKKRKRIDEQVV